ncbi:MAG: hypothetical protein A3B86_04320 [Candidatus Yanofskybacteria bacterium RIFCSPHIGHO2_02_FULL_38_22b]|uniref:Uncharacterized protein n=1 Tax=Candidatus Yanofskybacteria bacterium RIFCSPHIGHO2_02_FULL_38_22b TaxID=1802673 RepID=A0A1F8EZL1_9BACT|nr:MAG: hypothetical protein A2816_02090 [Candidatus Yanofskybacteria bacterium RIFCSPHIGHO2_01_FULL_39_44]OGN06314.1 MAG: hypothetical protein A3B86_04320 [Candidatus Yanofskybacteria bacterium RIFCSPHIGHO2_02_FULL_38_22b]OGN19733.1 MAG: hypothetical protein A2910_04055 [Candidatus Yanofskybacteria bacterium RIFCSPLOWO2_01_FULL_39_28]
MSLLNDIRKQPRHVREIMFGLCVIITVFFIGMIWFRSFEENVFVMLNTDENIQAKFYAEREKNAPIYANLTKAMGELRAAIYSTLGFIDDYSSKGVINIESDLSGKAYKLPISEDK